LKPVLAKRPSVMGGPRTNLQVVAIIERAHAIRQVILRRSTSFYNFI